LKYALVRPTVLGRSAVDLEVASVTLVNIGTTSVALSGIAITVTRELNKSRTPLK
jgi:hypothetical protein